MKQHIITKLTLPLLAFMAVVGVSVFAPSHASAALAGENGPILYVDNAATNQQADPSIAVPAPEPVVENTVNTTNPDGSNTIVADSNENQITSATISAQKPDTNYDVVYATENNTCELEIKPLDAAAVDDYCATEAELNLVTIDSNRNPLGDTITKTLDPLTKANGGELNNTRVYQTSYSPDGTQVLITVAGSNDRDYDYRSILLVSTQNFASSPVVTVVPTAKDKCLSGAFAQNGLIFFSSCPKYADTAGVYYYEAGADYTLPPKVLFENEIKSPYLIDVSPDSKEVLLTTLSRSCNYAKNVLNFRHDLSAGYCDYYYGTSNLVTPIPELSRDALEGKDFVQQKAGLGTLCINQQNFDHFFRLKES